MWTMLLANPQNFRIKLRYIIILKITWKCEKGTFQENCCSSLIRFLSLIQFPTMSKTRASACLLIKKEIKIIEFRPRHTFHQVSGVKQAKTNEKKSLQRERHSKTTLVQTKVSKKCDNTHVLYRVDPTVNIDQSDEIVSNERAVAAY